MKKVSKFDIGTIQTVVFSTCIPTASKHLDVLHTPALNFVEYRVRNTGANSATTERFDSLTEAVDKYNSIQIGDKN